MPLDRHAMLERNLDRQIAWIRASDAKITVLLPINTAMLAVLAAHLAQAHLAPIHWALAIAASLPCLVSFTAAVMSVMPMRRQPGGSLLYFGDISRHEPKAFHERVRGLDEDAHLEDLANQVHHSAQLAQIKMRHARRSYYFLFAALPFWVAAIYLLNRPN